MLQRFPALGLQTVQVMVTRGHSQFQIEASGLRATYGSFFARTPTVKDVNFNGSANEMLLSYCLPLLQRLAPKTNVGGLTLEDFMHSPTYHLEAILTDTSDAIVSILGSEHCSQEKPWNLRPTATANLPSACEEVLRIPASHFLLAPDREDLDNLYYLGGKVVNKTSNELLYFKPREDAREKEFDRELEILCRIRGLSINGEELRTSKLRGIVVSGSDGDETIGFVVTLISPHRMGMHPLERGFCGRFELHNQWEGQVRHTVHRLHLRGIVWGDVNPCNIVIDTDLNAWVIDFGGNFNWRFVDEDKKETEEGDWQGLERMFRDWLPKCRIWPTGEVGEINAGALN